MLNYRQRSVDVHQFAMVPRADIPRSSFRMETSHKTTFDAGYLIPMYVDEVLPGDTFRLKMTAFARLATPIFPIMDNLHFDSFFFFVPNRLVWDNWKKFMGEQVNPADSISYTVPQLVGEVNGYAVGSIFDYFGLPTVGQVSGGGQVDGINALPLRAYNLIWNEWFRDENLQNSVTVSKSDAPDATATYTLLRRGKRHDYFTSALPWPQKGNTAVSLPLGTRANISGLGMAVGAAGIAGPVTVKDSTTDAAGVAYPNTFQSATQNIHLRTQTVGADAVPDVFADLSTATAATINQIRQAFQIQKLLERDARGGTRYTEIVRAHFGVVSPDARLQRPEYLGGGSQRINIHPVAQTSGTSAAGTTTPLGNLAAAGTLLAHGHGFTQSFTEHGYIIGLCSVRADLTYQQGLRKLWTRSTRYDFYFPAFAMLGEQAVLNKEIYVQGATFTDNQVFGYQERWSEYRYHPARVSALFRSTSAGTIDPWHLAQRFTALPTLNSTFIQDTPPLSRALAVGAGANGQQLIADMFFDIRAARPMPMYSVPGLIDHF